MVGSSIGSEISPRGTCWVGIRYFLVMGSTVELPFSSFQDEGWYSTLCSSFLVGPYIGFTWWGCFLAWRRTFSRDDTRSIFYFGKF